MLNDLRGKAVLITLPDIHLTDLGKGSGGITPAELMQRVLAAVTEATTKAVATDVGKATKGISDLFKKKD